MEHQNKLNLLNEESDSKFVTRNGTFSIIHQTRTMIKEMIVITIMLTF